MHRLQTVLLRHQTRAGSHYDLLIEDPDTGPPERRTLWAARLDSPTSAWGAGPLVLTPLPPHRRRYLTFQGRLTGDRGAVRRHDAGTCRPLFWCGDRIRVECAFRDFRGVLELRRQSPVCWLGRAMRDENLGLGATAW